MRNLFDRKISVIRNSHEVIEIIQLYESIDENVFTWKWNVSRL